MILYEEIFRAFQREKVKYIVVGGIAVNLLGSLRNTADMDILVELSDRNLAKIVKILKKMRYHVKQPVNPMMVADEKTRKDWIRNKHLKAFNFYKEDELKEVDIILESPVTYEDAAKDNENVKAGSIKIPVISIDNLIKMKQKAGRDIDKLDIQTLKEIKRIKARL